MAKDLDRPQWRGQRPWFEIYFAVILDESRKRALWIRETLFIPKQGEGKATIWGAWYDADATPRSRATKRFATLEQAQTSDEEQLIRIDDSTLSRSGLVGNADGIAWDLRWWGGKPFGRELPAWLPAPQHARGLLHDADAEGTVTLDGNAVNVKGRALAMHLWGNRRVPTVHWIWAPWLGESSLEITAVSIRDAFSLGLSAFELGGPQPITGTPATAAHPHGLITATVAGARRLIHTHAWAEPDALIGYVKRDTDDRDLMVAQSAIGSAHLEVFQRKAPGTPWHLTDERRTTGGVALEIHQRSPLPGVDYVGWEDATATPAKKRLATVRSELVDWPPLGGIVALGLTFSDHAGEIGQKSEKRDVPVAFAKHARSFTVGHGAVTVPTSEALVAALAELETGLDAAIRERMPLVPAIMDYEGELALVALDAIDEEKLRAGVAQPFGMAAANDLTARMCQVFGEGMANQHDYWAVSKSFPGFMPVADQVWAPPEGITKIPEITIITRVNGEERQHGSTNDLLFDLPTLVHAATAQLGRPLARGDVILTGTPAGIGMRLSPIKRRIAAMVKDRFRKAELLVSNYATSNSLLRPGDVVEVEVGHAGCVRTRLTV